ncbi:MAG: hypothetical protein ACTSQJ_06105 [Promethearchaeota archaeon]
MANKWYKIMYQFWMNNLEKNAKRISIGFGSFLMVILTTFTTPFFFSALYGAGISFGSMVIMSIFGKNGNGQSIVENDKEMIRKIETDLISEADSKKKKITIP